MRLAVCRPYETCAWHQGKSDGTSLRIPSNHQRRCNPSNVARSGREGCVVRGERQRRPSYHLLAARDPLRRFPTIRCGSFGRSPQARNTTGRSRPLHPDWLRDGMAGIRPEGRARPVRAHFCGICPACAKTGATPAGAKIRLKRGVKSQRPTPGNHLPNDGFRRADLRAAEPGYGRSTRGTSPTGNVQSAWPAFALR